MIKLVQGGFLEAQKISSDNFSVHVCKNYLD